MSTIKFHVWLRISVCGVAKAQEKGQQKQAMTTCPHGTFAWKCEPCGGTGKCIHGHDNGCDQCGWINPCIHGKRWRNCLLCKPLGGGASFCDHSRKKWTCKLCPGPGICSHGKVKYTCTACRAVAEPGKHSKSFCQHNRQKYGCKDCGGKGICIHGKRKYSCKDCKTAKDDAADNDDVVATMIENGGSSSSSSSRNSS